MSSREGGLAEVAVSELVERARTGDGDAAAELCLRFADRVRARVRARLTPDLRRQFDSVDVTQSVLVQLLRNLGRFEDRGDRALRNWLYTAAENLVRSHLRRMRSSNGVRRELPLDAVALERMTSPLPGPESEAGRADDRTRLRALVAQLGGAQQEILRLRLVEERSFGEIAGRLGLPGANAARMRYARAVEALRARWS